MPRTSKLGLTYHKPSNRWKKTYQGKVYYFRADGKHRNEAYRQALAEFQAIANGHPINGGGEPPKPQPKPQPHPKPQQKTIGDAIKEYITERETDARMGSISLNRFVNLRQSFLYLKKYTDNPTTTIDESIINELREHLSSLVLKKKIASTTAACIATDIKTLMTWGWENRIIEDLPRNLRKLSVPRKPITIKTIPLETLKKIYDESSERNRLYILLALNCGFTQKDIATINSDMLTDGRLKRKRSKTGIEAQWLLWPETLTLLNQFGRVGNPMLINSNGLPLVSDSIVRGKYRKSDAIKNCWFRITKSLGYPYQFKQIRKTGATYIKKVEPSVYHLYLSHSPTNVADRF